MDEDPVPLRPVVGSALDPGDVVGRDDLILRMLQLLADGNNLLITDPRRMGKTAVLDRLVNEPRPTSGPRFEAVRIDYEGVDSAAEFLTRTVKELVSHATLGRRVAQALRPWVEVTGKVSGSAVGEVTIKATQKDRSAAEILDGVLSSAAANLAEDHTVLIVAMDEVPMAIANVVASGAAGHAEADRLLQTMQRVRKSSRSIRWIVTGSIGFHHTLRGVNASPQPLISDLRSVTVGPLDPDGARTLVRRLARGIGVTFAAGASDALIEECNRFPYFIQALMAKADDEGRGGDTLTVADVEALMIGYLDDPDRARVDDHTINRITLYYGDQAETARQILDRLLSGPCSTTKIDGTSATPAEVSATVTLLIQDHYLTRNGDEVSWRYPLVARMWARNRGLAYIKDTH